MAPSLRYALASALALILALFVGESSSTLYTDPVQLPSNRQYDYVVVGAGPGGSVMASRLSEDPDTNVLLIEAGPNDQGVQEIEIPFLAAQLRANTPFDWNYTTVPQRGLDQRVLQYPRGHVLGGSSSINFMIFTRSSRDDFDKYASISGDDGWSWDAIQPYYKKLEQLVSPVDNRSISGEINPAVHGTDGPLQVSLPGAPFPADGRIIETTQELKSEFPFNEDMNSGNPLGIGWMQATFGGGARSSASTAYVQPALSRKNFDVLINTTVTMLIHTGQESGKPVFRGVQFAQSPSSPKFAVNATKEVILSAGAINTPQLLMLSGLGPTSTLSSLGIPTVVDIPDIGQHLADHPLLPNQYSVANPADDVIESIGRNATLAGELVAEWATGRQGIMADTLGNHVGWLRIPNDDPIWKTETDPSAGPTSPHYEFLFGPGFVSNIEAPPSQGNFMTFLTILVSPSSRGSVTLASADPFTAPIVDPNFLDTAFDVYAMRSAIRSAARFASAQAWKGYLTGQADAFAAVNLSVDAQVDAWARAQTSTIWHPVGTTRMGACSAAGARKLTDEQVQGGSVVNPDLTVRGVKGLRIVDASVLPFVPAAHPQAVVYVFAERVADLVKNGSSCC